MANTYSKLYFHITVAVKGRANVISAKWKEELYKYISGIISNKGQIPIAINGMPDHIHLLFAMKPDHTLADLMRDIKANSSKFINEKNWVQGKFEWQVGYGAFTLGYSQLNMVIDYIKNQEVHHQTKTFREEYIEFLKENDVDFNADYIFDAIDF
jgi:putative transposase